MTETRGMFSKPLLRPSASSSVAVSPDERCSSVSTAPFVTFANA
jgi:hypothetical protein